MILTSPPDYFDWPAGLLWLARRTTLTGPPDYFGLLWLARRTTLTGPPDYFDYLSAATLTGIWLGQWATVLGGTLVYVL